MPTIEEFFSWMSQVKDDLSYIRCNMDHYFNQQSAKLQPEELINIEEACRILGLAKSTVYAMTQTHKIPFYQPGKKLMFKRSELIKWMEQSHRESAEQTQESILAAMQSGIRRKPANAYKL